MAILASSRWLAAATATEKLKSESNSRQQATQESANTQHAPHAARRALASIGVQISSQEDDNRDENKRGSESKRKRSAALDSAMDFGDDGKTSHETSARASLSLRDTMHQISST